MTAGYRYLAAWRGLLAVPPEAFGPASGIVGPRVAGTIPTSHKMPQQIVQLQLRHFMAVMGAGSCHMRTNNSACWTKSFRRHRK